MPHFEVSQCQPSVEAETMKKLEVTACGGPRGSFSGNVAVTSRTRSGLPEPQDLVNKYRGDCRSDAVTVGN